MITEQHPDQPDDTKPTIMAERMEPIEKDTYWDIFDSYFDFSTGQRDDATIDRDLRQNSERADEMKRRQMGIKVTTVHERSAVALDFSRECERPLVV